jgi:predicted transcriptional regulator
MGGAVIDPAWIEWGPDGVAAEARQRPDKMAIRHIEEAELRATVYRITHPKITAKKLARLAGIDVRTLYSFADGHRTPQPNTLRRLADAIEGLEGE